MSEQPSPGTCSQCGFNPEQSPNPLVYLPLGTVLKEDFIVGKILGCGGFGVTYLGFDIQLKWPVAIKEYFPKDQANRSANRLGVEPSMGQVENHFEYGLERFLEEAQTLARFNSTPGIVGVQRFFKANETGYMVMPYLKGMTLAEYLEKQGGQISYKDTMAILMPVMDALSQVHQQNLLHRDISPDNIFITREKHIKLIDFGAARMAARDHSQNFSIILKEGYAPEEQYRSRGKQGPWTDVYALGATLYRCITGQLPPQALDRAAEDERLIPPRESGVNITAEQEQALLKAMAVKANQRFSTVKDLQQALLKKKSIAEQATVAPQGEPIIPGRANASNIENDDDIQWLLMVVFTPIMMITLLVLLSLLA